MTPAQRKDRDVIFRVTQADYEAIQCAARAEGAASVSEYVRDATMRAVRGPGALERRVEAIEARLGIGQ